MIYNKENQLRVFTGFSGYDSQCLALDRLKRDFHDFDYTLVGWSEIDKYAIQAHDAIFPDATDKNYGDISKVDWNTVPDFDLFTYSFPCTDISTAGQQKGLSEGSGTRSSLLWECRRAIETKRPKHLLMENVKAFVSRKFLPHFKRWEQYLAGLGYTNFSKVMNATDYGVPQNRERIFMVSILDTNTSYHFPEPFPLEHKLKDVLEDEVDEKYYLSDKTVQTMLDLNARNAAKGNGFRFEPAKRTVGGVNREVAKTILTGQLRTDDNYIDEQPWEET